MAGVEPNLPSNPTGHEAEGMEEDLPLEQQLEAATKRAEELQTQLDSLRVSNATVSEPTNGAGGSGLPANQQPGNGNPGSTNQAQVAHWNSVSNGTALTIADVQSMFSAALTGLGEKLAATFHAGNHSTTTRFDVKAVNRKLQWSGHTDKRNPDIFLIQLDNQLKAANANTDEQCWQVAAELMDVAPLEMLSKRFGTERTAPFSEFKEWFLTTFTSMSAAARDFQVLELLTDFQGKIATTAKSVQTTGGLVSALETEFNRLVTFQLPDQLRIFFLSKFLPSNLAKEARIDPATGDLYTSFDAFKQRVLAIASAAGSQKSDKGFSNTPRFVATFSKQQRKRGNNGHNNGGSKGKAAKQHDGASPGTSKKLLETDSRVITFMRTLKGRDAACFNCKSGQHKPCDKYVPINESPLAAKFLQWASNNPKQG